jgi:UDP-N-acetylmuramate dehydrogenase
MLDGEMGESMGELKVREGVSLAPRTTFGVGGEARYFVEVKTEEDVVAAVAWAKERGLPLFVLGGGSNLLVRDEGFPGLVVGMGVMGVDARGDGVFEVGAGESWDGFVSEIVGLGCAGVECMAGIPGSVGGTPVQNVGAYGQEVSETIESVRAFDRKVGTFVDLDTAACRFRYRESLFNVDEPGRYLVTRVRFKLRVNGAPTLKYAELRERFVSAEIADPTHAAKGRVMNGAPGGLPTLREVAEAVREIRRAKGMLLVEGDADCRSAGSFFKNPVVGVEVLERVKAAAEGAEVPHWPAGEGRVKIPAAWLLEKAGFVKGYGEGRVGISSRHTLALMTRGGATFADVERMEGEIVRGVRERFGVELVREPVVLG